MNAAMVPAYIPSPPESLAKFSLGPLTIHAYALCILLGIVVAVWLTLRRWRARGGDTDVVWDVAIWSIPFGIVGGRLYHVFTSPDAYFGPGFNGTGDPIRILYIWNGGLGIWGAIALGGVGAWIATRRAGVRLSAMADAAAPGILLAQAIGRWGNWFNQELFGGPTTLPWGLKIDPSSPNFPAGYPADTLFHPTFLYECLWNVAGAVVLLLLDRRLKLRFGALFWLYVAIYTAGRTWIEALRIDEAQMITIGGITARLNVWTSLVMFVLAVLALILALLRGRNSTAHFMWLPGRVPAVAAEGQVPDAASTVPEAAAPAAVAGTATGAAVADGAAVPAPEAPQASAEAAASAADPAQEPAAAAPAAAPAEPASVTQPSASGSEDENPYPSADDVADDGPGDDRSVDDKPTDDGPADDTRA